jgi:hypothetical protein
MGSRSRKQWHDRCSWNCFRFVGDSGTMAKVSGMATSIADFYGPADRFRVGENALSGRPSSEVQSVPSGDGRVYTCHAKCSWYAFFFSPQLRIGSTQISQSCNAPSLGIRLISIAWPSACLRRARSLGLAGDLNLVRTAQTKLITQSCEGL